jgi:hypothetical protein
VWHGVPVRHAALHAAREVLAARIEADTVEASARQWRYEHLDAYEEAGPWLRREAEIVDTTDRSPGEVAAEVLARVELMPAPLGPA